MTFLDCLFYCIGQDDLVDEFNRLTGCQIGGADKRTALERAIDDATGHIPNQKDYLRFVNFVYTVIWTPLNENPTYPNFTTR